MLQLSYPEKIIKFTGNLLGKEMDVVGVKANRIGYIQGTYMSNSQQVIDREFVNPLSIRDHDSKYGISLDEMNILTGSSHNALETFNNIIQHATCHQHLRNIRPY